MNHLPNDYINFTIDDFVMDPFFKEWVLYSDPIHDEFWRVWKDTNPSKVNEVEEARALILSLEKSKLEMNSNELAAVWEASKTTLNSPQSLLNHLLTKGTSGLLSQRLRPLY